MADKASLTARWNNYQVSKTAVFWCCAASVAGALIVGFGWGGWVTGGTAREMVRTASVSARAELAASVCVSRFVTASGSTAQLASLKGTDSWKRNDIIEKGGWTTLAGAEKPVAGAAELCVQRLLDPTLVLGGSAGKS
jgi:hypothetical protein